jgi:DNA-binding MarR family transcriptional regulator
LQDLFDLLGGQKYKVAAYIMKNRAKENNILVTTIQELAEKVNVSTQTVLNTLQRLESGGLISRKTGSILVNAKLIHRGDAKKERYLLQKFECFDEKRKEKKTIKQLNKPTQINVERSII